MSTSPADDALVAAAVSGDRSALDRLLRQHYPRVLAVCRRITGNDADAADAAQEALLAIVRGLARFDGRSSFATWVYRIATNASLDELRRRRRRPLMLVREEQDRDPETQLVDSTADLHPQRLVDHMLLARALLDLPEDFRVAVVLRDVADLDYAEIAEVLTLPLGTVKSRIARGRSLLAVAVTHLDRDTGNPGPSGDRPTSEP